MFAEDAVAGNKMAALVEMLFRRWRGDVVVVKVVVVEKVVVVVEMRLFQNKDSKRIMANSKITARLHE